MPVVSVIIPVHNGEAYVENAIASALSQQDCDVEVIAVDDASRDQTRTVITNRMATDSRLRLVCLATQGGPSAARNAGIAAANGTWIALLDADDVETCSGPEAGDALSYAAFGDHGTREFFTHVRFHKHDDDRIVVHLLVELYARSADEATEVLEEAARGQLAITSLAEESRPPASGDDKPH